MTYQISRREVLNNLIRFKDNLAQKRGAENRRQGKDLEVLKDRKYKVLINRKTGDMRFAQRISSLEHHIARKGAKKETAEDWKEVQIIVQQKTNQETAHFEVRDARGQSIKPSDIEPLAWRIASETLDILNSKAKEIKGNQGDLLAEEAILQDLSTIHLAGGKERIEDLPGWAGSINRLEAEAKLTGKPVGTYLLREGDEITIAIAFHISEENHLSMHLYVMTVVEPEYKISDILLLQTSKGWTLYYDDPNLTDIEIYHYFPSPQGLLHHLNQIARYPYS